METERDMKLYHLHKFDQRLFLDSFFSTTCDQTLMEELVGFPTRIISKQCAAGEIKGKRLIDISVGSTFFHLIPVCESFSDFFLLEFSDSSIREMEAWKNKGRVAIDWSHASQFAEELGINSAKWKEKEDILRSKIKNISKIDFNQEHPADLSVLPKADCVISLYVMHNISESPDSFYRSIQTLASFMKPDGVLLLFGGYNASFYMVGENKFFPLPITQDMLMEALDRAGLTILCYETLQSKVRSSSIHYERLFFVKAGKLRKSLENNCNW